MVKRTEVPSDSRTEEMAEDKGRKPERIEKRGVAGEVARGFAGGVGAGVGAGLVAQGSQALGKLKPKPKEKS